MIAPRPEPVDISPASLPDRTGGTPLKQQPRGTSLAPSNAEVTELVAHVEHETWFGVYSSGQKVGFSRMVMRPARSGEPGGYLVALDSVVRSSADGVVDVLSTENAWRYAGIEPYALIALDTRESSEAGVVERRFSFGPSGGKLVTVTDGGAPETRSIAGTRETVSSSFACDPTRVKPGEKSSNLAFDETVLKDVEWRTTVKSVAHRQLAGVEVLVAALESYAPHDQSRYIEETAERGVTLSISMGDGFEMKAEPRESVGRGIGSMDAMHDGVGITTDLGDPSRIEKLSLVLESGESFAPPDSPNQRVTKVGQGRYRLELTRGVGAETSPSDTKEYLLPTAAIDSDHPSIVELAARLVSGVSEPAARAKALLDYVNLEVADSYATNLTTASQVAARLTGDCSEHTLLFIALARAAGIPAREISGLVYTSDQERRFVWHAWAEVALDQHWLPVDPTFGELHANATHIKLGSERDARWVSYGRLSIQIESVH